VNAFAQFTVPEIKAGLLAVIALGTTMVALFVVFAMVRAGAGAVARQVARSGRAARALFGNSTAEVAIRTRRLSGHGYQKRLG
jgi:threonine/homoserine/homoserine lactone efflux protein